MKGYWKREDETKGAFVDQYGERWLRTGDIAYVDERGCFFIVDRMKVRCGGLYIWVTADIL